MSIIFPSVQKDINSFLLSNRHSNKYGLIVLSGLIVLLSCVFLLVTKTECVMVSSAVDLILRIGLYIIVWVATRLSPYQRS